MVKTCNRENVVERVSVSDVEEAVLKGKKALRREKGLTEAFFRRFSVVYIEKVYRKTDLRKVFPVTVKVH
jgi:hypothetical protein